MASGLMFDHVNRPPSKRAASRSEGLAILLAVRIASGPSAATDLIRCLLIGNVALLVRELSESLEERRFPRLEYNRGRTTNRASALTFAADSWYALVRCVGGHSENVAGRSLNALCPLRDRLCHDVRLRRDGIWRRSRDARLPYCARLEPLNFSR